MLNLNITLIIIGRIPIHCYGLPSSSYPDRFRLSKVASVN